MAATLSETADLAVWPKFVRAVKSAMVTKAVAVGKEPVDNPPTEPQRLRHALSANVLRDPDAWSSTFAWAVAANPAVSYTSTDSDIQYTVNEEVWDAMAGVIPTSS